ncbi:hypothetical protein BS639_13295, partial [Rouxiella silvae]
VGSPHARVGNCQASNKQRNLSRKTEVFLFNSLMAGCLLEKRAGLKASLLARCLQRPEGCMTKSYINCQASNKAQNLSESWGFLLIDVCKRAKSRVNGHENRAPVVRQGPFCV